MAASKKKAGITFAQLSYLLGLRPDQEEYILKIIDTTGANLAVEIREGLLWRMRTLEQALPLREKTLLSVCWCCGDDEQVYHPIDSPLPICHVCDRMPRSQRLLNGYLRHLVLRLDQHLEQMAQTARDENERAQQLSVADLEQIWREQVSEDEC